MPELPEVETTCRALQPLITGKVVARAILHRKNLRWTIPAHLPSTLANQTVQSVHRRAKYILIQFKIGTLIIHLGMSGKIKVVPSTTPLQKHDHFELQLSNHTALRLNDPRRFGAVLFSADGAHPLLDALGVEPLSDAFDEDYLYVWSRKKSQSIKAVLMNAKIVVGIGNIYACESLFHAKIDPTKPAGSVSKAQYVALTRAIKRTLAQSIEAGGTTLKDFAQVDGNPGYFAQQLSVYGRENAPCTRCSGKIARFLQHQRATFHCPLCQH